MADAKKPSRIDAYNDEFTAKITKALKDGTTPWQKPWKPGEQSAHRNFSTDRRKRDGFVPLGDVAEAVALPGDHALTRPRRLQLSKEEFDEVSNEHETLRRRLRRVNSFRQLGRNVLGVFVGKDENRHEIVLCLVEELYVFLDADLVQVVLGLRFRDQRRDGVDVAPPEVLAIPLRLDRRSTAPAENIRDDFYVHALLFGILQGLGGNKRGKLRRITVNPVDRILSRVSEVPVRRRIVRVAHNSERKGRFRLHRFF